MNKRNVVIGRIVHYVLEYHIPGAPSQYHERPAIIVSVGQDEIVDLQVFLNGDNVPPQNTYTPPSILWRIAVKHDETQSDGTWHWPDEVGPTVKHEFLKPQGGEYEQDFVP